jgi:type IV pilus assembly protein PilC
VNEFVIKLADERGRMQEQVHAAATAEELRQRFLQSGYYVYWVKPRGMTGAKSRRKKVKLETFLIFNQQFLTLIRAGLPILTSLALLSKRQKDTMLSTQLEDVSSRVRTGESLSSAFEAQGSFPVIYTTTVQAGERAGNLGEVLERYIGFQRVALTFRKKLIASLIYPMLLVVAATVLISFLIGFVVPRFGELFSQMGSKLPAFTVFLMSVGTDVQHYGLYGLAVVVIVGFLIIRWAMTDAGSLAVDRLRLALPLFGSVWLKYQVALFARTLSTLLTGGLPLVPSLETAARSIASRQIGNAVLEGVGTVREGKTLAQSLEETKVFPEMSLEMIEVGESTGALPAMLNSVAEFYEEDVQTSLTALMSLIEPAILVVMGIIVAAILIALYLPIISMGSSGMGAGTQ